MVLETVDSRVAHSAGVGEPCRQGPCRGCPGKGLVGETCFVHPIFVALVLVVALSVLCLRLLSGFPLLPCYAWPWRVALTARAQVKGSKGEPLLLYTDRSPLAWAIHKRNTLLGQAQNGARAVGADFYHGNCSVCCASPTTRVEHVASGRAGVCDRSMLASSCGGQ